MELSDKRIYLHYKRLRKKYKQDHDMIRNKLAEKFPDEDTNEALQRILMDIVAKSLETHGTKKE